MRALGYFVARRHVPIFAANRGHGKSTSAEPRKYLHRFPGFSRPIETADGNSMVKPYPPCTCVAARELSIAALDE